MTSGYGESFFYTSTQEAGNYCLDSSTLVVDPPPVNGMYLPSTTINFCYTIHGWNQIGNNWLHGLELDFGLGWNMSSFVPTNIPASCSGLGQWGLYTSVFGQNTQTSYGFGFYFDSTIGGPLDGDPGNNFGDDCSNPYSWMFCWDIATDSCRNDMDEWDLDVTINATGDGESGAWGTIGCENDPEDMLTLSLDCCLQSTLQLHPSPDLCTNPGSGSIDLTVTGGQPPYTIDWSNDGVGDFDDPMDISGLSEGGYFVSVIDATGCLTEQDTFVGLISGIDVDIDTISPPSCDSSILGVAEATAIGGTEPYTYIWSTGEIGQLATALVPGFNLLLVIDDDGCQEPVQFFFPPDDSLNIDTFHVVNADCNQSNGQIIIEVSGGSPPYLYEIPSLVSQTSDTISNLAEGAYYVVVTDSLGCMESITIPVRSNGEIMLTNIFSSPETCGISNGSISVNTIGGVGDYTYVWDDPNMSTTSFVSGLSAGTYGVTVSGTLASGAVCFDIGSILVNEVPYVQLDSVIVQNITCVNPGGNITIQTSVGPEPVLYSIGGDFQMSNSFFGLSTGEYIVTAMDVVGCSVSDTVVVIEDFSALSLDVEADRDSICLGEFVTLSVNGADNYSWMPVNGLSDPEASTTTATPNETTTYFVTGSLEGPKLVNNGDFEVLDTAFISDYLQSTGVGGAMGDLTDSGTYGIYTSPVDGNASFQDCGDHTTGAGYMLVGNGATSSGVNVWCQTVNVFNNLEYLFNAWVANVNANSSDPLSQFEVFINGDSIGAFSAPQSLCSWEEFTFEWMSESADEAEICIQTVSTFSTGNNFALDDISLVAICPAIESVTIYVSDPEIAIAGKIIGTCEDECDGEVEVGVTGGFAANDYMYSWDDPNSQTTNSASGLCAGIVNLTVTDDIGCESFLEIQIDESQPLILDLEVVNPSCSEINDGMIDLTITDAGGTVPTCVLIEWSGPNGFESNDEDIVDLSQGMYAVTVSDCTACLTIAHATVVAPPSVDLTVLASPDSICVGESAQLSVSGGGPGYTWSPDSDLDNPISATPIATPTVTTTYFVVTKDGMCSVSDSITIYVSDPLAQISNAETAGCEGECNGSATVVGMNGFGDFNYQWDDPSLQTSITATGLCEGQYNVTISDEIGCIGEISVQVLASPDPVIDDVEITPEICFAQNGELEIFASISFGDLEYSIDGGTTFQPTSFFTNLPAGSYSIVVQSSVGCKTTQEINLPREETISFAIIPSDPTCGDPNGEITIVPEVGTPPFQFSIDGGSSFQSDSLFTELSEGDYNIVVIDANNCEGGGQVMLDNNTEPIEPTITSSAPEVCGDNVVLSVDLFTEYLWSTGETTQAITVSETGDYSVVVVDPDGCQTTDVINITSCDFWDVPNAFSPNGDGLNETFGAETIGDVSVIILKVFNRWGEIVYEGPGPWDGIYKGELQPMDVYVYTITVRLPNGNLESSAGDFVLIR